ncbi:hypothetical protein [Desulfitobacterium sp.]|nr:hypothetical protein [Desulfitobacterium sp.]HVJ49764.1 hypothetical protein [Desulfitobacterium sp.]
MEGRSGERSFRGLAAPLVHMQKAEGFGRAPSEAREPAMETLST